MPLYDRRCAKCGHVWETTERMDAPEKVRCVACGRREAIRRPCAPALRTDTNIPAEVRQGAAMAGTRVETRADLAAMRARGVDFCTNRDMDYCNSRRGKAAHEEFDRVLAEDAAPIKIESGRRRRSKVHAGAGA